MESCVSRSEKSKHLFIDEKKPGYGKLACEKHIVAAAQNTAKAFLKMISLLIKKSAVTSDFNHPSEDYVKYICTDLSAEMMSTENEGQNSSR